jgi:hypothetical protein
MNNIVFLTFYLIFYFSGLGIIKLFSRNSKNNLDNINNSKLLFHDLYPLLTLFILGNLNLFLNFFLPINKIVLPLLSIIFSLFIYGLFTSFKSRFKSISILNQLIVPLIVSFSSYGIKFHYDAGAYHLNYQNWIYKEKIVFGLSNLNPYYSYGSIQEYISATFQYFELNLLLYFVELIFFVSFLGFLYTLIRQNKNFFLKKSALLLSIFLFMDNFGYKGGGNGSVQIQMVSKPDTAVGILWVITTLFIINALVRKETNNTELFIILLTSLFAFQLKINSAPLVLLIIFYLYYFKNKLNFFHKNNLWLYFLAFSFFVKNLVISGCFIYPLNITCIRTVSWINFSHIKESGDITRGRGEPLRLNNGFMDWFNNFFSHAHNEQIYTNLVLTLLIIFFFNKVFYKRIKKKNHPLKLYIIFLIFNYALFLLTVPAFRNGFGLFMSTVLIFSITENTTKESLNFLFNRFTYITLILIISMLLPRSFMYSDARNNDLDLKDFDMEVSTYTNLDEEYVYSNETNQCWEKQNCILRTKYNVVITSSKINNYLFIESKN